MHTRTFVSFVPLRHRIKATDTCVLFHPGIGLGFNRGQKQNFRCNQSRAEFLPEKRLQRFQAGGCKGTKLHSKSPTAERRHVLCVGVGGDRTHAIPLQKSRVCLGYGGRMYL